MSPKEIGVCECGGCTRKRNAFRAFSRRFFKALPRKAVRAGSLRAMVDTLDRYGLIVKQFRIRSIIGQVEISIRSAVGIAPIQC